MRLWRFAGTLLLAGSLGCLSMDSKSEREIPLTQVPEAARKAAEGAVKGIKLTEAEVEEENGHVVYEIEGTADGKEYEIEVTADGRVLEVEEEKQDDED